MYKFTTSYLLNKQSRPSLFIHKIIIIFTEEETTTVPSTDNKVVDTSKVETPTGDTKMVQEENNVNDGADEQMLGAEDNEKLAEKREEVKFIKGDHQNGDAKIDIGTVNGKVSYFLLIKVYRI